MTSSHTVAARSRVSIAATLAAGLVLAAMIVVGFTTGSGPSSTSFADTDQVVLVAVPGLRWQDLEAIETDHLEPLLGAAGLLSVRSIGPETTRLEGYLAFGAGNRLDTEPTDELDDVAARCLPEFAARAQAEADDGLNGAEVGALGTALHAAGLTTAVVGSSEAVPALMDSEGCVDRRDIADGWADVTLIELDGLAATATAAERATVLHDIDAQIGALDLPGAALVVVFAPSAPDDADEVVVVGVRDATSTTVTPASMVSPSTRRADYVQLTDLAPLVLERVGLDVPSAMSGTAAAATASDDASDDARTSRLADLSERVHMRDDLVGPVSVVLVVLIVLCGVAALGRRARPARMLAPIVIAYPTVTFLMGLVAFHQLPLDFVVVAVPVVAMVLAAVVTSLTSRWGAWAPVTALAVLLWLTLVIDIVTGGELQINTPLGYSPTVAGRFQGFGNLAFGLVAAASLVVALCIALASDQARAARPAWRLPVIGWSLWIGAVTLVAVAAPAFGADVGGTLALVPAIAGLATVLAGHRIRPWRALGVLVAACAAVAVLAVIDRARPADSRTHLGRFLDELLDGDGGLIIRRKLHGNLSILTSSFWSYILIGLVVVGAVVAWRRRAPMFAALRDRPIVHAFLTGFAIVAVLGFALNDSGLAVPSIMTAVAVPWTVAMCIPVVRRAGR